LRENWNAFMNGQLNIAPAGSGVLDGQTFAVKDVFAIKQYKNSAGNPDWLRTHKQAEQNAPVIEALLKYGGTLKGTTHTDELMYSLNGENYYYGTPVNPCAKDRIPGGSSSGSAVAVAAGLVDFALGTDTGGSIRIPASYCGLFGIRPSHGLVDIEGVIPLAKSFDTVGWMARNPELLLEIGEILIPKENSSDDDFQQLYFDQEAWSFIEEDTRECLLTLVTLLQEKYSSQIVKTTGKGLAEWAQLFRTIQGIEIWREHGPWIEEVKPAFGPGIAERFQWASTLNRDELGPKTRIREKIKQDLSDLLKDNGLLVIPTAPGEAPLRDLPVDKMEQYRSRAMQLTCIAGLSGFPQVTIPIFKQNGLPAGLSFIANKHQDLKLLKWVVEVTSFLKEKNIEIG